MVPNEQPTDRSSRELNPINHLAQDLAALVRGKSKEQAQADSQQLRHSPSNNNNSSRVALETSLVTIGEHGIWNGDLSPTYDQDDVVGGLVQKMHSGTQSNSKDHLPIINYHIANMTMNSKMNWKTDADSHRDIEEYAALNEIL